MKCPKCKGLLVEDYTPNLYDEWEYKLFLWQIKCVNCGFRYDRFGHKNRIAPKTKRRIKQKTYRRYARKFNVHDVEE